MPKILVGNTFPLVLVRRRVVISPVGADEALSLLKDGFVSFWGHSNTLEAAKAQLGVDLAPATERPALRLDAEGLPTLEGVTSSYVLVLSPNYRQGFRPAMGVEVQPADILGWEPLLVYFPKDREVEAMDFAN